MNRKTFFILPMAVVFLITAYFLLIPGMPTTARADEVEFYDTGRADPILSHGGGGGYIGAISTSSLEYRYLREARRYRAQGRYELARQSYAQALAICGSTRRLATIRHELDGLELLLRTLR